MPSQWGCLPRGHRDPAGSWEPEGPRGSASSSLSAAASPWETELRATSRWPAPPLPCFPSAGGLPPPATPCRAPSPVRPRPPGPAQGVASATSDLSPVSQKATLGSLCLLKAQILHPYFFPLTKCGNMGLIRVLYMFTTTQYDLRIKEKSISARKHSCILFSIKEKSISLRGQVGVHNLLFPTCLIGLVLNQVRKSIRKHFTNVSSHGFTHTHTHTHNTLEVFSSNSQSPCAWGPRSKTGGAGYRAESLSFAA